MRKAMVTIFATFMLFCIAYIAVARITDPRQPFDTIAQSHPLLSISFTACTYAAEIALLAIALGGIVILGAAVIRAIKTEQHNLLVLFGGAGAIIVVCTLSIIFFAFTNLLYGQAFIGSLFLLGWFCAAGLSAILICLGILKSHFSAKILRFALLPMCVATAAMGSALLALLIWSITIWFGVPQFAASEGLYSAGLGGGGGLLLALGMMIVAVGTASRALWQSVKALRSNPPDKEPAYHVQHMMH